MNIEREYRKRILEQKRQIAEDKKREERQKMDTTKLTKRQKERLLKNLKKELEG